VVPFPPPCPLPHQVTQCKREIGFVDVLTCDRRGHCYRPLRPELLLRHGKQVYVLLKSDLALK
jgi:hypothetical protein